MGRQRRWQACHSWWRRHVHEPAPQQSDAAESADLRGGQTTQANKDLFRPYPGFTSVLRSSNWGTSNYNGIETSVTRRFINGLQFQASYVVSKSSDTRDRFLVELVRTHSEHGDRRTRIPVRAEVPILGASQARFSIRHAARADEALRPVRRAEVFDANYAS